MGELIDENSIVESDEKIVSRLSKLSDMAYDKVREEEAAAMGIRVGTLDKERKKLTKKHDISGGSIVIEDEPCDAPFNILEVMDGIRQIIQTYMSLPHGAVDVVSLWIAGTYVYDAFAIFPKLVVISPEKRCGKTTLLEIIDGLSCKSITASNITPAAIFRTIDLCNPTLIIDEADTFIAGRNDDLIGIINSGHRKNSAYIIRTVGEDHEPKKFSTWSPMAIATIKQLPGTVMDRSIVITLKRKTKIERVARLPVGLKEQCEPIRQKLTRWADDNLSQLKAHNVEPPEIENDRAMDNWLPLFTIAHAVADDWEKEVQASFFALNKMVDDKTPQIMILGDIKDILEDTGYEKIGSAYLVDKLISLEERPWSEWKRGQPMTQNTLSKMLGTFDIRSKDIRPDHDGLVCRGFEKTQFQDTFDRYLENNPVQSATTLQAICGEASSVALGGNGNAPIIQSATLMGRQGEGCSTVALQNPNTGEGENISRIVTEEF